LDKLLTRASSINRALDQIGDKWCLLILQEVFWGINSFSELREAIGVSRGVLSDRLKWLQSVDCLRQVAEKEGGRRMSYHLTRKSVELYDCALAALAWERRFFRDPALDDIALVHRDCGHEFAAQMRCRRCGEVVVSGDVSYRAGPGATRDERPKKIRRRSSVPPADVPSRHPAYRNLVNIVGDRWTSNLIALAFHGFTRFDQFHQELPLATNILSDRLRFLVEEGIFEQSAYQQRPLRHEYRLSDRGEALYPWFLALLQWGDRWCDAEKHGKPLRLIHNNCGGSLIGQFHCSACQGVLRARDVAFESPGC
jgi:DNA-binding HxlR family transcriptional regulator